MLVARNLKNHIMESSYLPTIADLVKKPKKEESIFDRIPNAEETRKRMLELEKPVENPATPEQVEYYKREIEKILKKARDKFGGKRTYNPFD